MIRKIIKIDESKCNGCGACASACHEGAIGMVDGKARLMREDYCDGLGDCLPACPTGAITFEEREAPAYDHEAVMAAKKTAAGRGAADGCDGAAPGGPAPVSGGCPGTMAKVIKRSGDAGGVGGYDGVTPGVVDDYGDAGGYGVVGGYATLPLRSRLSQWPVQIKLVPVRAPYFDGADLLIAADCTAYAYGNFHNEFIRNRVTLIGCPKLDEGDYSEKLTEIIRENDIKSVTIVRMEVPCCGGLEFAAKKALQDSGKFIPWHVVTISTDGRLLD